MNPLRVRLHPATDLWARGAHTGTALDSKAGRVRVLVDALRRKVWFAARDVIHPAESADTSDADREQFWQDRE